MGMFDYSTDFSPYPYKNSNPYGRNDLGYTPMVVGWGGGQFLAHPGTGGILGVSPTDPTYGIPQTPRTSPTPSPQAAPPGPAPQALPGSTSPGPANQPPTAPLTGLSRLILGMGGPSPISPGTGLGAPDTPPGPIPIGRDPNDPKYQRGRYSPLPNPAPLPGPAPGTQGYLTPQEQNPTDNPLWHQRIPVDRPEVNNSNIMWRGMTGLGPMIPPGMSTFGGELVSATGFRNLGGELTSDLTGPRGTNPGPVPPERSVTAIPIGRDPNDSKYWRRPGNISTGYSPLPNTGGYNSPPGSAPPGFKWVLVAA